MHGKRTLNKLLNEKAKKPNRSPYTVNSSIVMIGDWKLEEVDGNLQATNLETGAVAILGVK